MSNMYDEDPIRTKHASKEYLEGWERTFGEKPVNEYGDGSAGDMPEEARVGYAGNIAMKPDGTVEIDAVDQNAKDALEMRLRLWGWRCNTCNAIVYDPENHQAHAIIKLTDE